MPPAQHLVGMAEIKVAVGHAQFTCLGLGSCIGLIAFDPDAHVAGMVHVMLPAAFKDKPVDKPGKFADTGIPEMLKLLKEAGALQQRLIYAYAGGAQVFKYGAGASSTLDVGARNTTAVEEHLKKLGARVVAKEVGGSAGRTVLFDTATGEVRVRTVAAGEKLLGALGAARMRAA